METFLIALLQCTLSMSIITLVYEATMPILSKRYASKWRYMVWLVIAIGWLIPFRPLIELPFLSAQSADTLLMPAQLAPASAVINNSAEMLTSGHEAVASTQELSIWTIAGLIWVAGVIFMLAYHVLRHRHFLKIVGRWSEAVTTPDILNLMDVLKQEQGIKSNIEYKTCSSVSSPMMVGFFHPVVLMPPVQLSKNELTLILRHELTHFKRHDLWYKAMIITATVLHWFNPVAYFMARAASLQCEISCDALVLRNADMQTRKQYGETIIAVVRNGRKHQTVLSTNFYGGKQGLKNRIMSMLDSKRKKTGLAVLCIVLVGIMLTGATLVSTRSQATFIPNTAFTAEEYGKLLALRFDGYENMSVSDFQQKVWEARDTAEYMELLERFDKDDQLYEMKDTNDIASFLFYELTPLTAEKWESWCYSDAGMTNYKDSDNAQFEYSCTLSILNANQLTVHEYDQTRRGVITELSTFFQERTKEELQDELGIRDSFDAEIKRLTQNWSSDSLSINIEYFFLPLILHEDNQISVSGDDFFIEEREHPNGTEKDYSSLLKLMTADYQSRTLTDFNVDLLAWGNEDYERMERISTDAAYQDFNVSLSPEELSFVTLTVNYSGSENAALIKSKRTGEPKENIGFSDSLPEKTLEQKGQTEAWCSLYYQGSYHITDDSHMTVGERDRCVSGVISDIQKYWDEASLDELLTMNKQDVLAKMEGIAVQYSNNFITISIIPDQVSFDVMNERSNNE